MGIFWSRPNAKHVENPERKKKLTEVSINLETYEDRRPSPVRQSQTFNKKIYKSNENVNVKCDSALEHHEIRKRIDKGVRAFTNQRDDKSNQNVKQFEQRNKTRPMVMNRKHQTQNIITLPSTHNHNYRKQHLELNITTEQRSIKEFTQIEIIPNSEEEKNLTTSQNLILKNREGPSQEETLKKIVVKWQTAVVRNPNQNDTHTVQLQNIDEEQQFQNKTPVILHKQSLDQYDEERFLFDIIREFDEILSEFNEYLHKTNEQRAINNYKANNFISTLPCAPQSIFPEIKKAEIVHHQDIENRHEFQSRVIYNSLYRPPNAINNKSVRFDRVDIENFEKDLIIETEHTAKMAFSAQSQYENLTLNNSDNNIFLNISNEPQAKEEFFVKKSENKFLHEDKKQIQDDPTSSEIQWKENVNYMQPATTKNQLIDFQDSTDVKSEKGEVQISEELEILDVNQYFKDDLDLKTITWMNVDDQIATVTNYANKINVEIKKMSVLRFSIEYFVFNEKLMNLILHLDKLSCQKNTPTCIKKIEAIQFIKNLQLYLDETAEEDD